MEIRRRSRIFQQEGSSVAAVQSVKRKPLPVPLIAISFVVSLGLAAAVLAINGINAKSLKVALGVTARWSFLFFWMAYAGGALAKLFGSVFAPLARRGREFGLSYAAAMFIHFSLVLWLFQLTSRAPLSENSLIFFLIGFVFTYLLALCSVGRVADALGPSGWRALRFVGMNYILLAFASDFVPTLMRPGTAHHGALRIVAYAPFAAMSVAAPLLVLAPAAYRRVRMRYSRVGLHPAV